MVRFGTYWGGNSCFPSCMPAASDTAAALAPDKMARLEKSADGNSLLLNGTLAALEVEAAAAYREDSFHCGPARKTNTASSGAMNRLVLACNTSVENATDRRTARPGIRGSGNSCSPICIPAAFEAADVAVAVAVAGPIDSRYWKPTMKTEIAIWMDQMARFEKSGDGQLWCRNCMLEASEAAAAVAAGSIESFHSTLTMKTTATATATAVGQQMFPETNGAGSLCFPSWISAAFEAAAAVTDRMNRPEAVGSGSTGQCRLDSTRKKMTGNHRM